MELSWIFLYLILGFSCSVNSQLTRPDSDGALYKKVVNRVTLGGVGPFEQPSVEKAVWHMEIDNTNTDAYIFADGSSLATFNHITGTQSTIVGESSSTSYREGIGKEAEFNRISSFSFVNHTHIVAVDHFNHCLRLIDRVTRSTSRLSGTCETQGYQNGDFLTAQFSKPWTIIATTDWQKLYLTDSGNNAIREIDNVNQVVQTWVTLGSSPRGITTGRPGLTFHITTPTELIRINRETRRVSSLISSKTLGFQDGHFSNAKFNNPLGIKLIERDTLLVADTGNNRIRVIDLNSLTVSSICNGDDDFSSRYSGINNCEVGQPLSVLKTQLGAAVLGTNSSEMSLLQYLMESRSRPPSPYDRKPNGGRDRDLGRQPPQESSTLAPNHQNSMPDAMVIVVSVVTAGVVLIAIVVAVSVVICKRRANRTPKPGPTANLDLAVKNSIKRASGRPHGKAENQASNPYDEYTEVEEPYQVLPVAGDQNQGYALLDTDSSQDTPLSQRSMRYGPLPRRPTSSDAHYETATASGSANNPYYVSPVDIIEDDEEIKKGVNNVNPNVVLGDYGYVDFQKEHCSHEEISSLKSEPE